MTAPARTFPGHRRVRLGDATGTARIRLDALARYLQDVATDDATDAGLADGWVLRRLALRIDEFPRFRDAVDLLTWCSGVAGSAAERCTTLHVDGRLAVDAVALWVFVGPDGRPARLDPERFAVYGTAATGRRIPTRLRHGDPPPEASARPWPLRAMDVDVLRHVNNAVSLAAVEDILRDLGADDAPVPWTVEVEYRAAIDPGDAPDLVWARDPGGALVGGLCCGGAVRTTFRVVLPGAPGVGP
ncbi:MAG: acyl-ACP thioesterase domain-containing protein [Acidimicrobiia bacterium]|jgi:acyl-ACP thioesterase